ncbi:glycosyltransferase family 39 protein [Pusillimonas sp.]|uniref:glycosyltransferase family 39 protein n=1 Tax=Pusillimonas sp. TaxID=3040095 RepID=UPI0037C57E21
MHDSTTKAKGEAGPSLALNVTVLAFLAGMVGLWTILCAVSHKAPDLDGMEELVWASSFEFGYTKHPPLPSWLLYALTSIFGKPIWLVFFAGQLVSALGLWFVWRLGCEFTSPRRALIATLMVSTTLYFSLRGTIYNHNTAQLWSIAASTWLFYRALRYGRASSWLWLGAVAGLAMMTKYSAVVQFGIFLIFIVVLGHWRDPKVQRGIVQALIVFLVVISPHVYWLIDNHFAPFGYLDRSLETQSYSDVLKGIFDFTVDQLARISPMFIVWLGLYVWHRRRPVAERGQTYASELSKWDRSFLLWVGLGPFLATILMSAVLGSRLTASWGTTFFILYGYFAFWWLSGSVQATLRRTVILVIAVHVLMAMGYALARGPLAHYSGRMTRSTFPGPEIALRMQQAWDAHVPGAPLGLVASDTWLGGNIAINLDPVAEVFVGANYAQSPWLSPDTALDCGVLVAYSPTWGTRPSEALLSLHEQATWKGVESLRWSSEKSPVIEVVWGIVPPTDACAR